LAGFAASSLAKETLARFLADIERVALGESVILAADQDLAGAADIDDAELAAPGGRHRCDRLRRRQNDRLPPGMAPPTMTRSRWRRSA
jgi:hypothetical protein